MSMCFSPWNLTTKKHPRSHFHIQRCFHVQVWVRRAIEGRFRSLMFLVTKWLFDQPKWPHKTKNKTQIQVVGGFNFNPFEKISVKLDHLPSLPSSLAAAESLAMELVELAGQLLYFWVPEDPTWRKVRGDAFNFGMNVIMSCLIFSGLVSFHWRCWFWCWLLVTGAVMVGKDTSITTG